MATKKMTAADKAKADYDKKMEKLKKSDPQRYRYIKSIASGKSKGDLIKKSKK